MVQTLFYYELPTMKRKGKQRTRKRKRDVEKRGREGKGGEDN